MFWRSTMPRQAPAPSCSMRMAGCAAPAQMELIQCYPRPGWIEHDPEEIWRSVVSTCREAVTAADAPIAAIGIANQRDDRDRSRHRNRRGNTLNRLRLSHDRVPLVIDPYFYASKISWLLDAMPGLRHRAQAGEIAFGTIDGFLLWRLSGRKRHATDVTNASRTMLFDIRRLAWDAQLPSPSASRTRCCPKCWKRAPIRAWRYRNCTASRSRSPGWPETNRRQ